MSEFGLTYHTDPDGSNYWNEGVCYKLQKEIVERCKTATEELHKICVKAVEFEFNDNKTLNQLGIPQTFWPLVKNSFVRGDSSVYGRFDLTLDENGTVKMYEYNADATAGLLESSIVQRDWISHFPFPHNQFNRIHEELVSTWNHLKLTKGFDKANLHV